MTQNRSHAVMAQRTEPHDSLDDFPTPPWAARAFCEWMGFDRTMTVWEPAANRGFMVKGLRDYFHRVDGSDIHDYGAGFPVHDFLMPGDPLHRPGWIITNPPFRLAMEFVERGLDVSNHGVAVIVRSTWAEGSGRFNRLFSKHPPKFILQHVERVPMVKGRYDPTASTATGYAWYVWQCNMAPTEHTRFGWIPPSRATLYRRGDEDWGLQ